MFNKHVAIRIPQWTTPEARKFRDDIKARYGFEPYASAGGLCHDTAMYFIKVLQSLLTEYGDLTRESFVKCSEEQVMTDKLPFTDGLLMEEYKPSPSPSPIPWRARATASSPSFSTSTKRAQ